MKNRLVTLGLTQYAMSESPEKNRKTALRLARAAARRGANIVCLPELFASPYFPRKARAPFKRYAETIPGPSIAAFSALAKELAIVVIVPLFESAPGGKFYNTAVVIDADGRRGVPYRKMHIPQDPSFYEKNYFRPGDRGFRIYKTRYGKIAPLICYDQWFPEAARAATLAGAELLFYPTAIGTLKGHRPPEGDWREAWITVQRGHAIANSVHLAAVNRVGVEGKMKFWGTSFVSDSFGNIVARAGEQEAVVVAKIDLALNRFVSGGWGFQRNRRPDAYRSLKRRATRCPPNGSRTTRSGFPGRMTN